MIAYQHVDANSQYWPNPSQTPPPVPLQFVLGDTMIKGMPLLLDKMVQLKGEAALFIDFQ